MTPTIAPDSLARSFASTAKTLTAPSIISLPLHDAASRFARADNLEGLLREADVVWRPAGKETIFLGFGREVVLKGDRTSSLVDAAKAVAKFRDVPRILESSQLAHPHFFGGARFATGGTRDAAWDAFGGWQFVLPRYLVAITGAEVVASVNLLIEPGLSEQAIDARLTAGLAYQARNDTFDAVSRERDWCGAVQTALREIAAGSYEKVVLARMVALHRPGGIDEGEVLSRLVSQYPQCFAFKMRTKDGAWTGATPELLCRVQQGRVSTVAMAGSKPRGADRNEDDLLAGQLMGESKERHEHALVVQALQENLSPFCTELTMPNAPEVLRLPNIQHLRTAIEGRLRSATSVLDVAAVLHPSPAVGGWPRPEALAAIERLEGIDRGWYGGPIGRVDLDGNGEFAVGLRSALLRAYDAQLYAGAGIVSGSNLERETAETETKLRPLREAIGGE